MKISPIYTNNIFYKKTTPNTSKSFGISSDVFIKTSNKNPALEWLQGINYSFDDIKNIINDENNVIGRGYSHVVYNIPNNNDLVLRTTNDLNINKIKEPKLLIKDVEDKDLKINIGQPLVEITISGKSSNTKKKIEILKKQSGIPLGVFPIEALSSQHNNLRFSSKQNKEKYSKSLDVLAKFPVSSYENLFRTIKEASEANYSFDFINSNNLLYDENTKSINVIDMEKGYNAINYGGILYALVNAAYSNTYHNIGYKIKQEDKQKALDNTQQIINKYIQAMENTGLNDKIENCMYSYVNLFLSSFIKSYSL